MKQIIESRVRAILVLLTNQAASQSAVESLLPAALAFAEAAVATESYYAPAAQRISSYIASAISAELKAGRLHKVKHPRRSYKPSITAQKIAALLRGNLPMPRSRFLSSTQIKK